MATPAEFAATIKQRAATAPIDPARVAAWAAAVLPEAPREGADRTEQVMGTPKTPQTGRKEWTPFTAQKKALFLDLLAAGHTAAHAARACGIRRTTAYLARERDPDFAAAWDIALEDGIQVLEQEARRRAVAGVTREKGVYHQGEKVGTESVTEYSDTLLIFLLKAKRPDLYRERAEVKHTGQVNHAHASIDLTHAPTDSIRAFVEQGRRLLDALPDGRADAG